ncbi:MAG: hypothetical protein ACOCQD_05525 [archaeon]
MSNEEYEIEINSEGNDTELKKKDKPKYHSEEEQRHVESIKRTNLDETEKELGSRIVVQYRDPMTNIDTFNALSKRVLIHDENGKRIIINNHDEIRKHKIKTAMERKKEEASNIEIIDNIEDEIEFED